MATTIVDYARAESARQLVLGATRWSRRRELLHGSVINKAIRTAGPIEVHVIPARRPPRQVEPAAIGAPPPPRPVELPGPRRAAAWALAVAAPIAVTAALVPLRSSLGLAGALLCALIAVVGVALLGGFRPALLATVIGVLAADFFYTQPLYSFRVAHMVDVVGLITFVVVAGAVGGLVDRLTRQGVQAAQAQAEAEDLARLAADAMTASAQIAEAVGSIRDVFDLDGVAVLRRDGTTWHVDASAGRTRLKDPDDADYSVELADGRVLALTGRLFQPERHAPAHVPQPAPGPARTRPPRRPRSQGAPGMSAGPAFFTPRHRSARREPAASTTPGRGHRSIPRDGIRARPGPAAPPTAW